MANIIPPDNQTIGRGSSGPQMTSAGVVDQRTIDMNNISDMLSLLSGDSVAWDVGLAGWNFDPGSVTAGSSVALATAGTLYVQGIQLRSAVTVTNLLTILTVNGGTLTTGQCFGALYAGAGGALIGATADQATAWGSGAVKLVTAALAGGPYLVQPGAVYAAFWFNGTTGPTFLRSGAAAPAVNLGLAAAASRWGTADTGKTTTAPTTLGTISAASNAYWVGLS